MADDILGSFTQGMSGGLDMVSKAVDVHRKREELQEKRKAHELSKFDSLMNDMNNVRIAPKGRIRDLLIDKAQQRQQIVGNVVDPGVWDAMRGDEYQVPLAKLLTHGRNMVDADERYEYMEASLPGVADAGTFLTGMSEMLMKGDTEMAKATKSKTDAGADRLKQTTEQAESLQKAFTFQVQTINASNKINVLGAKPATRDNPAAREAVKFLLQRMNDPAASVREPEYERAAGIGQGGFDKVKSWANDFINGEGKFNEKQWKMVIDLSSSMGQHSQDEVGRAVAQKSELYRGAGIDPEDVARTIPQFTPFDYEGAGFGKPRELRSKRDKEISDAMKKKEVESKKKIEELKEKLLQTGRYTADQIESMIKKAREEKGTVNGSTK